jgi:hypothetical protein
MKTELESCKDEEGAIRLVVLLGGLVVAVGLRVRKGRGSEVYARD